MRAPKAIVASLHRGAATFVAVVAVAVVSAGAALAQGSSTQFKKFTFNDQGPSPSVGTGWAATSNDIDWNNGTDTGAIQSVLASPTAPGTLFVGTVNGGVWSTANGGTSWKALTDKQSSLSIGSMAFKEDDSRTIFAGVGVTSNGKFADVYTLQDSKPVPDNVIARGGARTGVLVSYDGGEKWEQLAGSEGLVGKSVVGVAGKGNVVLAATAEYNSPGLTDGYGLYRSVGGAKFELVPATSLPSAPATSLVGGGTKTNPYYVAIAGNGVYRSIDNGQKWEKTTATVGPDQAAKLATGPGGAVAVAVYNNLDVPRATLVGLYLAPDGATFRLLPEVPPVINGGQATTDLALAIDPTNPNVVYVGGDRGVSPTTTLGIYRVTVDARGKATMASIGADGTSNETTSHADARGFAFDASGRLLVASDGGIYARSEPQSANGTWTGLNSAALSLRESYAVAFDAVSKRLVVAAQDNGVTLQSLPGETGYTSQSGGDGLNAVVNDSRADRSSIYYSTQNLGYLSRIEIDAAGNVSQPTRLINGTPRLVKVKEGDKEKEVSGFWNFETTDFTEPDPDGKQLPFSSRFLLNRVDPAKVAIGTNFVYLTTEDKLAAAAGNPAAKPLTKLEPGFLGAITAMAYGAGTVDGFGGSALVAGIGPDTEGKTNKGSIYFTRDGGTVKLEKTDYAGLTPSSVVFDADTWKRFYVSDSTGVWGATASVSDPVKFAPAVTNLSTLKIERPTSLEFIAFNGVRALLVGGIRSEPGAQSPIAVAISRGGVLDAAVPFGSELPNTMVNLLSYNPKVDLLAVGLWGRGIWTLYDVTSYFPTADTLMYGLADNDSKPSEFYLTNGEKLSRGLEKWGGGTLTIDGTSKYDGSTTVLGGTLVVNGSLASSSGVTVRPGGTLAGGGIVPATTVLGTIAPGIAANAPTTLTVQAGYLQGASSAYNVLVSAAGSDLVRVNGTATLLGGTVMAQVQSGNFVPRQSYTIVNATGGITGTFNAVLSSYPFLQPSLSYAGNSVFLTLAAGGFSAAAQTPAQAAVANALDASVWQASGDYATVIGALALLNTSQMQSTLTALSGTNYSGIANTVVQGAQLFMSNFQAQAGGNTGQANRVALAEACDVACDSTAPGQWGVWGGALGGLGTVGAGQAVGGVTYNLGGFAAGLDRRFGENFLAGVAIGYAGGSQWVSGFAGQGFTNTVQAGLYGSFLQGPLYVDGLAGYAFTASQTTRSISIPGLATRTAVGQTGINQLFGQVEAGWRFDIGTAADAYVTPFVRLQGYTGMQGAFTESGAQSLDLSVAAQTTYSLRSVLGAQVGGAMDLGWREKLALQFRLGWSHEYADTSRPVSATLAGAPASPFTTFGISPTRDGALLGLSASTAIADATSVYLRYEGLVAGQDSSHALTAGVRLTW